MAGSEPLALCVGCGALVPDFRYPGAASPRCWAMFGEILAREYEELGHSPIGRLTADAFAAQHPGTLTLQTMQSVTVHLISLCSLLGCGYTPCGAAELMRSAIERFKGDFAWLESPLRRGELTVLDVVGRDNLSERVERRARTVWEACSGHREAIRCWARRLEGGRWRT